MPQQEDSLEQLFQKLQALENAQTSFAAEIIQLRVDIERLQFSNQEIKSEKPFASTVETFTTVETPVPKVEPSAPRFGNTRPENQSSLQPKKPTKSPASKTNLEKFIGENLINKVGILITIIGVAIGAKYSVDNNLISPIARILLGYGVGIGLLFFGIRLKTKYESFSAVLVSGAIAILYLLTFLAYSMYGLFPQTATFLLMLLFTIFAVVAAIHYNRSIIALIGLAGGYAIPFLLSDGSGKVEIMFAYMAIINTGILIIAFKKYWKTVYITSFVFTWLIYFSWFVFEYDDSKQFYTAALFLIIFFIQFYSTFLSYRLIKSEKYQFADIILLLLNAFIFFGLGYGVLSGNEIFKNYLGLFTLCNALLHAIVAAVIYRKKLADNQLFYLVAGLVLVFITIAIPVQLEGSWVTMLWITEATLLFWIGRTKQVAMYEKISYVMMLLAFLSILEDWSGSANRFYDIDFGVNAFPPTPFFNIGFFTGLLYGAASLFIAWIYYNKKWSSPSGDKTLLNWVLQIFIPGVLVFVFYNTFKLEVEGLCTTSYLNSGIKKVMQTGQLPELILNVDLLRFQFLWVINYSLFFFTGLLFINYRWIKKSLFGDVLFAITLFAVLLFLVQGLYRLGLLKDSYLAPVTDFTANSFYILMRYVCYAFVGLALYVSWLHIRQKSAANSARHFFNLFVHMVIVGVLSSEMITWLSIAGVTQTYKFGLSILWGVYALLLIGMGIWKKQQYVRIAGIVLFAGTLVKLFVYDITHLNSIAKTIAFVSLGVLLLIISFLYNKYKHLIANEDAVNKTS